MLSGNSRIAKCYTRACTCFHYYFLLSFTLLLFLHFFLPLFLFQSSPPIFHFTFTIASCAMNMVQTDSNDPPLLINVAYSATLFDTVHSGSKAVLISIRVLQYTNRQVCVCLWLSLLQRRKGRDNLLRDAESVEMPFQFEDKCRGFFCFFLTRLGQSIVFKNKETEPFAVHVPSLPKMCQIIFSIFLLYRVYQCPKIPFLA